MKLSEAIERGQIMVAMRINTSYRHERTALELLIEASKRWQIHRELCPECYMEFVPGETKE